jgi:hypothetical protein
MEPKAKWSVLYAESNEWAAEVGPFVLQVAPRVGRCEIWQDKPSYRIWEHLAPTPCDVTDLMRLTEAELARRLVTTAETMEGGELVASALQAGLAANDRAEHNIPDSHRDPIFNDEDDVPVVRSTPKPEMKFNIGDRVECLDTYLWQWHAGTVRSRYFKPESYRVTCDDGFEGLFKTAHLRAIATPPATNPAPEQPRHHPRAISEWPRFNIGDLVRVPFSAVSRVGVVTAVPEDEYVCFNVSIDGVKHVYATCDVHPYTIPPINSYADLADVLDELPEGVVVEFKERGCYPVQSRRSGASYEARLPLNAGYEPTPWSASELLGGRSAKSVHATCRIVPPSEVGE